MISAQPREGETAMTARALVTALALVTVVLWTAAPGSAQNAAPAPGTDQTQTYHHPAAGESPMGAPMMRGGMRFQGGGPGMMGEGMGGGMMSMMGGMMAGNPGMMAGHVEGRLAFLKTELKITEAQAPQWTKFADAMRATADSMN